MVALVGSHCVAIGFPWVSYGFPWNSYGFPMGSNGFLLVSQRFPRFPLFLPRDVLLFSPGISYGFHWFPKDLLWFFVAKSLHGMEPKLLRN